MQRTASSWLVLPEITMTGGQAWWGVSRKTAKTSMPFISGISMSSSIKSNRSRTSVSIASRPSLASVMSDKPISIKDFRKPMRIKRLSSTNKTLAFWKSEETLVPMSNSAALLRLSELGADLPTVGCMTGISSLRAGF